MAEITMKSTKAEIMEAYKAAVEKLDTRDRMIDDPAKEAAKAKKVEVIESADATAKEDIFNPEIIKKYNDLTEAIEIKQLELDELYELLELFLDISMSSLNIINFTFIIIFRFSNKYTKKTV